MLCGSLWAFILTACKTVSLPEACRVAERAVRWDDGNDGNGEDGKRRKREVKLIKNSNQFFT